MKDNSLIPVLKNHGIEVFEINRWRHYLRGMWEQIFIKNIDEQEKRRIYLNQFLWHGFSYKKVNCLNGHEARTAFNNLTKRTCFIFYQNQSIALRIEKAENLKAKYFEQENDVYIVDTEFKWTYVKTHEDHIGPFFVVNSERIIEEI